jgi:pyruvate dehydrogenase phosphatase
MVCRATQELYVACTGDCRAVAGYWDEKAGAWVADPLSEDQTGDAENEVQRLKLEHPGEESTVVNQGRVVGHLQVTRAFGDINYKWPANALQSFLPSIMPDGIKAYRMAPNYLTPPYVTARPEVEYRKFSLPPPKKGASSEPTLRFIIMATDGFWDEITNVEAVVLAGTYLSGLRTKSIARTALPQTIPQPPTTTTLKLASSGGPDSSYLVYETTPQKGLTHRPIQQDPESRRQGHWAFVDDNVGTHLIRNAFGGGDQLALRERLSIPAPHARRYRDDITVSVIWWEEIDGVPVTEKAKL